MGKIVTLDEISRPESIAIDSKSNKIYIVEGASIYIFSLNDFKYVKKFGKTGSGPQEFYVLPIAKLSLYIQDDCLFIRTVSKISYFTKDGVYKNEARTLSRISAFFPSNTGFVGEAIKNDDNKSYYTVGLYDNKFNLVKEIYRQKSPLQMSNVFDPTNQKLPVLLFKYNRVFVNGENGIIHIFDPSGKELSSLAYPYEKLEVTDSLKEKVKEVYKKDPRTSAFYESLESMMKFPAYFPSIREYIVADNQVYVLPYKNKEGEKSTFLVFDLNGKFIKKAPVAFSEQNILEAYPYTIDSGKLYQLVENEDEETWNLHINNL